MRPCLLTVLVLVLAAPPAPAQLKEIGVEVLKGILSKGIDAGIDYLWGKDTAPDQRVAELQRQLSSYEAGLRQVELSGRNMTLRGRSGRDLVLPLTYGIKETTIADNRRWSWPICCVTRDKPDAR